MKSGGGGFFCSPVTSDFNISVVFLDLMRGHDHQDVADPGGRPHRASQRSPAHPGGEFFAFAARELVPADVWLPEETVWAWHFFFQPALAFEGPRATQPG